MIEGQKSTICGEHSDEARIAQVGFNNSHDPVRKVICRCGWSHMTALRKTELEAADEYLTRRFEEHKIND